MTQLNAKPVNTPQGRCVEFVFEEGGVDGLEKRIAVFKAPLEIARPFASYVLSLCDPDADWSKIPPSGS